MCNAMMRLAIVVFLVIICLISIQGEGNKHTLNLELNLGESDPHSKNSNRPNEGGLLPPATLLASTLDGTLVALNKLDGDILWNLNDQPAVKSPYDSSKPSFPAFLPDPKDGSIYMMGMSGKDPLKKLPFTIPELVAASPCKSSDGILYTGKKIDTWLSVDRLTGRKRGAISPYGCSALGDQSSCPKGEHGDFLIGRTEYNIMMYDSRVKNGKGWNISFFDYSSNLGAIDIGPNYDMVHFTDSSTGSLLTLDRETGSVVWETPLKSPVVAMYLVQDDGIAAVPFTSVSKETMENLVDHFDGPDWSTSSETSVKQLFPTLYIGEHSHGLYAMPSLVDKQTLTISTHSTGPLLLEGNVPNAPPEHEQKKPAALSSGNKFDIPGIDRENENAVLLFGYYKVPDASTIRITPHSNRLQLPAAIASEERKQLPNHKPNFVPGYPFITQASQKQCGYNESVIAIGMEAVRSLDHKFIFSVDFLFFCRELLSVARENWMEMENKELKVIAALMIVLVLTVIRFVRASTSPLSTYGSHGRMSSNSVGSSGSTSQYEVTAHPVDLGDGNIRVGNIQYEKESVLGKGCEGTFVYKGKFDNRDVAVKRVLAACFSIADREVELLRESDEHPNVIRYFCMEQDSQFRYIALEYCAATLQDYVEGKYVNDKLDPLSILRQATQGLFHLHNLDICHRDIKPHNVLISMPGKKGDIRAMISDFGLCKKLKVGRMSFSRRSGIAGTEGWIAPEMMLGNKSTTCLVDIFSLGCVYYYVLSGGYHPFGESFRRQANILSGESDLSKIDGDPVAKKLIEKMVSQDLKMRPPAGAVLKHPIFWNLEKRLMFLQDISDRIELDDKDSALVHAIERNRFEVLGGNWYDQLDGKIAEDLRKRRGYNGKSLRDLLRAMRNKKHHYQELTNEVKQIYGRLPDQFANYWFTKFPKLFIHSWHAMHCLKNETSFAKYYHRNYDFLSVTSYNQDCVNRVSGHGDAFQTNGPLFPVEENASVKSENSSVISKWEDRVFSDTDEDASMKKAVVAPSKPEGTFYDMSKPLPQVAVQKDLTESQKPKYNRLNVNNLIAESNVDKVTVNNAFSRSPKASPKAPKVRRNVIQLETAAAEDLKLRPSVWVHAVSRTPTSSESTDTTTKAEDEDQFSSEYSNHSGDNLELLEEPEEDLFEKCISDPICDIVGDVKGHPVWVIPTEVDQSGKKSKRKKKKPKKT